MDGNRLYGPTTSLNDAESQARDWRRTVATRWRASPLPAGAVLARRLPRSFSRSISRSPSSSSNWRRVGWQGAGGA